MSSSNATGNETAAGHAWALASKKGRAILGGYAFAMCLPVANVPLSAAPYGAMRLAPYPNPVSRTATVAFELAPATGACLDLYDVLGRAVAVLAEGLHSAGSHTVRLDASRLAPGLYIIRLSAERWPRDDLPSSGEAPARRQRQPSQG